MTTLVALPSAAPGGLDAGLSDHFGHCDAFTLVTVDGNRVADVRTLPNADHADGGCLVPVRTLAGAGVRVLIAGAMGMRPLAGFADAGIMVLHNGGAETVGKAVAALINGRLARFDPRFTCGGGRP